MYSTPNYICVCHFLQHISGFVKYQQYWLDCPEVSYVLLLGNCQSDNLLNVLYLKQHNLPATNYYLNESQWHLMAPCGPCNHYLTPHLWLEDRGKEGIVGNRNDGVIETGSPSISHKFPRKCQTPVSVRVTAYVCVCGQDFRAFRGIL